MTNIKYTLVYLTDPGLAMHGYAIIDKYKFCALALVDIKKGKSKYQISSLFRVI